MQRLDQYDDDHHRCNRVDSWGILHTRDKSEKERYKQLVCELEYDRQYRREGADDEAAPDDEVYVPQSVTQDREAERQWYQELEKDNGRWY